MQYGFIPRVAIAIGVMGNVAFNSAPTDLFVNNLLQEDGFNLLQEDGGLILLEQEYG